MHLCRAKLQCITTSNNPKNINVNTKNLLIALQHMLADYTNGIYNQGPHAPPKRESAWPRAILSLPAHSLKVVINQNPEQPIHLSIARYPWWLHLISSWGEELEGEEGIPLADAVIDLVHHLHFQPLLTEQRWLLTRNSG